MRLLYFAMIAAFSLTGCASSASPKEPVATSASPKGRVVIRVEVVRFLEDDIHVHHEDGADSSVSEIELKVVHPEEFRGICLIEHWGGYAAGGDFTTVGNVFDATADSRLLDKKNIGSDGKIHGYALPYVALEGFKLVKRASPSAEPAP